MHSFVMQYSFVHRFRQTFFLKLNSATKNTSDTCSKVNRNNLLNSKIFNNKKNNN